MAGEWPKVSIAQVAERVAMGPFGSSIKVATFVPNGVPVISGQHLHGWKLDERVEFNFVSEEHAHRLRNANVLRGDVIFTHAGNIGQVAFIPESSRFERYVISQRQFYMRCNRAKVLPEFVVAYFKTPEGQHQLLANTSQVGVPSIAQPVTYLRTIEIPLPPLAEQRAIAHILGTLDDKIELNRRMSETLEAMARALFKSWFVDFEPVRAKCRGDLHGRPRWQRGQSLPGLPAHLYDLFPDRLVDSELGEIPEGWEVGKVVDIGVIICGKTPPTRVAEYYGAEVPFITIPDMHGKVFITETHKKLSRAGAESQPNKMLPKGSICVSCIATPGLVAITAEPSQTNQQINTVVPTHSDETYFWFWSLRNLGEEIWVYGSGGSVVTNLSTGRFSELRVLFPSRNLRSLYHSFSESIFSRILENEFESRTLAALRDALLPKLIRGEIRVKDVERFLEERGL